MKLVTHQLAIGGKSGQVHFVDEKNDDAVYGFVVWKFSLYFLVSGGIPDFNQYGPHGCDPLSDSCSDCLRAGKACGIQAASEEVYTPDKYNATLKAMRWIG